MRQSERAESSISAYSYLIGDMATERSVFNDTLAELDSTDNLSEHDDLESETFVDQVV